MNGANELTATGGPSPAGEDGPLTREELQLRMLLLGHAALSFAFLVGYVAGGDVSTLGFVPNSVAKDGLFVVLSVLAAGHVRRNGWLVLVLATAYGCLVAGQLFTLAHGGLPRQDLIGVEVSPALALLAWMAVDLLLTAWLVAWWSRAVKARYDLRYLNPAAFLALIALAEVLIDGRDEVVPPARVAANVDRYLSRLQARGRRDVKRGLTVLAFFPLLTLRLPFAAMAPADRLRHLETRFLEDVSRRRWPRPLRPYVQALIRVASQMAYLGYYGDRGSWKSVGYTRFAERPGGRPAVPRDHPQRPLVSLKAPPQRGYDAIVVGSGAAGAILAYRYAEAGRRVLVVERGPHVDPREFTDDEIGQYLKLYNDGALQMATDFRLQVLQGMCVGGSTTVNNAVCLDPPDEVLERWAQRGIDPAGLRAAIAEVAAWLNVATIDPRVVPVGARRFAAGAAALDLPGELALVRANIDPGCLGCGYCNIGCAYGKKLSMLDSVLPWAQRDFPGRLEVLADFHAGRIVTEGPRAIGVEGERHGERLFLEAGEIVVAAGAVGSSWLLQRSGLGGDRTGAALHFNINSPLTAEFPDPVDSFAGLQMTHAYRPGGGAPGYVLETWFNPVATQALAMPGWFGRHFENMRRYRHMACGGALVGTTTPGRVRATRHGPRIEYAPSSADLARVVEGIKLIGRIFLQAEARRVMPATYAWHAFGRASELDELDRYVTENADLMLTSAHPQSGNPVGEIGEGGVVDAEFRVHGFENLRLCDASAFPSSVTVNPQLTVMGLAQYASRRILGAAAGTGASPEAPCRRASASAAP